ncbi:hypothetical protein BGZ49_001713, partial [Haplosporangium sp. Z 27]
FWSIGLRLLLILLLRRLGLGLRLLLGLRLRLRLIRRLELLWVALIGVHLAVKGWSTMKSSWLLTH